MVADIVSLNDELSLPFPRAAGLILAGLTPAHSAVSVAYQHSLFHLQKDTGDEEVPPLVQFSRWGTEVRQSSHLLSTMEQVNPMSV